MDPITLQAAIDASKAAAPTLDPPTMATRMVAICNLVYAGHAMQDAFAKLDEDERVLVRAEFSRRLTPRHGYLFDLESLPVERLYMWLYSAATDYCREHGFDFYKLGSH